MRIARDDLKDPAIARLAPDGCHDAHSAFRATARFGSLDGLRCLSILAVIWHHGPGARQAGIGGQGFLGVQLFFAISGFLITALLLRERDTNGRIHLANFYARRSLRIFPLYFTALAVYAALIHFTARDTPSGRQFFANLPWFATYTSNWFVGAAPVVFGFAWSLAAEEQFYCGWPWVERFLGGARATGIMLGLVALGLCWALWAPASRIGDPLAVRMIACLPLAICWGVLLAHTLHSRRGFALAWRLFRSPWASCFLLALLLALIGARTPQIAIHPVMALLVGSCVTCPNHRLAPLLNWAPAVHTGAISYGMYLVHGLVYNAAAVPARLLGWRSWGHSLPEFLTVLAGTVLAATLSFRYYESFFHGLKSRFATGGRSGS